MKKIIIIGLFFVSCKNDSISKDVLGNGFEVEFLFEKDGVKVYRFEDGNTHYFTTLGETITTRKINQGKAVTVYDENIK